MRPRSLNPYGAQGGELHQTSQPCSPGPSVVNGGHICHPAMFRPGSRPEMVNQDSVPTLVCRYALWGAQCLFLCRRCGNSRRDNNALGRVHLRMKDAALPDLSPDVEASLDVFSL